jgi:hypothetical protein
MHKVKLSINYVYAKQSLASMNIKHKVEFDLPQILGKKATQNLKVKKP